MTVLFFCAENYESVYRGTFEAIFTEEIAAKSDVRFIWAYRSSAVRRLVSQTRGDGSPLLLLPAVNSRRGLLIKYVRYVGDIWRVFSTLRREPINVIHCFDDALVAFFASFVCRLRHISLLCQITHLKEEQVILQWKVDRGSLADYLKGRVGLETRNFALRRADHVFGVSAEMLSYLRTAGVVRGGASVIPAGVQLPAASDPDAVSEAKRLRGRLGLDDKSVILYVGTLNRFRRLDMMLDVVRECLRAGNDVVLVVVSREQDNIRWLASEAESRGVSEKVMFCDAPRKEDLTQYIVMSDVCLAPYGSNRVNNCNSPVKVLEYVLNGKSVVSSRIPSQREVFGERYGDFCVDHDPQSYARKVLDILKNPRLYSERIATVRDRVVTERAFSAIAARILPVYHDLARTSHDSSGRARGAGL